MSQTMVVPSAAAETSASQGENKARDAAPQSGGAHDDFITTLNSNDVLCGRGSGPNDHAGNIRFRQLVLSRKAEYLSTNARQAKAKIAQEIVDHVRFNVDPPGRFLKRADADALGDAGFPRGAEVWCPVTEDVALEKAKQALRQNRDRHLVEAQIQQHVKQQQNSAKDGGGKPTHRSRGSDVVTVSSGESYPSAYAAPGGGDGAITPSPPPCHPYGGADPYYSMGHPAVRPPRAAPRAAAAPPPTLPPQPHPHPHAQPALYPGGGEPAPMVGGPGSGAGQHGHVVSFAPGQHPPPPPHPHGYSLETPFAGGGGPPPPQHPHGYALEGPYQGGVGPPYHGGGSGGADHGMGPPPGAIRRTSKERESMTVADLERDFRQIQDERNQRRLAREREGQAYAQQEQQKQFLQYQQQQQQPGAAPAAPKQGAQFQEHFPYALGGRGPSADSIGPIDPVPVNQREASLRISGKTMEFIASAFNDGSPQDQEQQGRQQQQSERQQQFLEQQAQRMAAASEAPPSAELPQTTDGLPSVDSIGLDPQRRSSNISALTDMSATDMSLSSSEFGLSKELPGMKFQRHGQQGSSVRPQCIKEGRREDLSESERELDVGSSHNTPLQEDVEGNAAAVAPDSVGSEATEPRRISSIKRNPDSINHMGNSSMSIMKGLGTTDMDSCSMFSGMSVLMSDISLVDGKELEEGEETGKGT